MIMASGGGGSSCGTRTCGDGGGGSRSPSSTFHERPLKGEITPFLSQMRTRDVRGGVPSPRIEPKMGRQRKGPT